MPRPSAPRLPLPPVEGDWFPLAPRDHRAQLKGLLRRLGGTARRILDVGCGDGRVAVPLARAGHHVLAVDRDRAALRACSDAAERAGVAGRVRCVRADVLRHRHGALRSGPFDAAVCLGHAFMELDDPVRACAFLSSLRGAMHGQPRCFLAIDDLCEPLWREVASGRWREGTSGDGAWQLVWAGGDNAFTLRRGAGVRPTDWTIRDHDRRLRLWSMGELRLLAHASGWRPPRRSAPDRLIVLGFRR